MGSRKRKRICSNNEYSVSRLPEPIIQYIQSFLSTKEGARTTLLSKSWQSAWLTRPNLEFDAKEIRPIRRLATETFKRYQELSINIESFSLRDIKHFSESKQGRSRRTHRATDLIVGALEFRVTRFSFYSDIRNYVLPKEVFAASEHLVALALGGCIIDLGLNRDAVRFPRLQSLSLENVKVQSCGMLFHIISNCPSIEKLSLCHIDEPPAARDHDVVADALPTLHSLRSLVLDHVYCISLFLPDLSSKFPSLKYLSLECPSEGNQGDIRISSLSLELLSIVSETRIKRAEFDVPSLRKFTFEGPVIKSLCFVSTSRQWEANVSTRYTYPNILWFNYMNHFLTRLGGSKIDLSLRVYEHASFDYDVEDIQGLPKPEVENLTIDITDLPSLNCYALFDGLFRICRPKFITQYLLSKLSYRWKINNYFLCKMLLQETTQSLAMHSLLDLKGASVEVFDGEWQDRRPWKSLLDAPPPSPTKNRKIRFRLEWKP